MITMFIKRHHLKLILTSLLLAVPMIFTQNCSKSSLPSDPGSSGNPGSSPWLKVSPNGRYFVFENGQPFIPMGVAMAGDNINMDYYGTTTIAGQTVQFGTDHFIDLFSSMKAHGENFLRIDIEGTSLYPRGDIERLIAEGKIQFLEDPVGVFNEQYAQRIDRLLSLAKAYGIYIDLVLITHTCDVTVIANNLDLYPYHESKGGPLETMDDLFTKSSAKTLWKARLEYISNRWGSSDRIAAWELYNELLNCGGTKAAAAEAWVSEMGQHLRNYETSRYGRAHPVIVSTVHIEPENDFFYDSPGTDMMVSHYYKKPANVGNPIVIALDIHQATLNNLSKINYSQPFFENERTLAPKYSVEIQKEVEHQASWSYMASGAASPGATWMHMGEGEYGAYRTKSVVEQTHKAMTQILKLIDFSNFNSRPWSATSSNTQITPMVIGDGSKFLGWLLHSNSDDYAIEIIQAWLADDPSVPFFNTYAVNEYLRFYDEAGVTVPLDGAISDLSLIIQKYYPVSAVVADQLATQIVNDVENAKSILAPYGPPSDPAAFEADLKAWIKSLQAQMQQFEVQHHVLSDAYNGHPNVSTTLTMNGLNSGQHTIIWFNDSTGVEIGRHSFSGSQLTITTPSFQRHLAFVIQ